MSKTKTTFEVTIETGCEPTAKGPYATTRVTVSVGGVAKQEMIAPDAHSLGYVMARLYSEACVEFTATRLGAN